MGIELSRRNFLQATAALGVSELVADLAETHKAPPLPVAMRRSGVRRPVTPAFFGLNGNNVQGGLRWDRADLDAALRRLQPGILRYPGGTIGNYWAWRRGWFQPSGPWPGQDTTIRFDNSLSRYRQALQASGAQALFMLNLLTVDGRLATRTDNARMIRDQVAFLRAAAAAGIKVERVELGNEFYLAGGAPGPHAHDYIDRFPTAGSYARVANSWVAALRAAFPRVRIAAVGANSTRFDSPRRAGWNDAVLARLSGVDALTMHPYIVVRDTAATPQSLLSLPYSQVQNLKASEFVELSSRHLDAWITEFNVVDKTPDLHFAGTWAHGLCVATFALLLAQSPVVSLIDLHNVAGEALNGVLFDSTEGFGPSGPPTRFLGRSAMGATYAVLLHAAGGATTGQRLGFPHGPVLAGGAPALVGMEFAGPGHHQAVLVNLAVNEVPLDVSEVFSGSVTWSRVSAASLTTKVTGPRSLMASSGTTTRRLHVPGHSIVRLWQ